LYACARQPQHLFFVGTAPSPGDGHGNASPKGLTSLNILDERTVASGAFEGPPRIVRLHGRGEAVNPGDRRVDGLRGAFHVPGTARSVMRLWRAPISLRRRAAQLGAWAARKGEEGLQRYQREKNALSVDGLPGLRWTGSGA